MFRPSPTSQQKILYAKYYTENANKKQHKDQLKTLTLLSLYFNTTIQKNEFRSQENRRTENLWWKHKQMNMSNYYMIFILNHIPWRVQDTKNFVRMPTTGDKSLNKESSTLRMTAITYSVQQRTPLDQTEEQSPQSLPFSTKDMYNK